MTSTTDEDPRVREACTRMAGVANALQRIIGPTTTANVMLGTAVTLLAMHMGNEAAADYLDQLAEGLRDEADSISVN